MPSSCKIPPFPRSRIAIDSNLYIAKLWLAGSIAILAFLSRDSQSALKRSNYYLDGAFLALGANVIAGACSRALSSIGVKRMNSGAQ